MRKGFTLVITVLVLMIIAGCGGGGGGNNDNNDNTGSPSFQTKAEELNYISKLSSDEISGVISGQNCGHGNEIVTGGYVNCIEKLRQQSGKYVGIIGIDYGYQKLYSLEELKQGNTYLKNYWNKGGLVTVTWSPANPWGVAKDWTDVETDKSPGDIQELITPGSAKYDGWIASLDLIATALADLKQAGVIVLWRPIQEMNGNWFWWGKYDDSDTPKYINIWRHMYNYFNNTKGLDNLIWVFSPCGAMDSTSYPYPGDEYVDIIAPTRYNDNLIFNYDDLVNFGSDHGKPIAMAEYGPENNDGTILDGTFDNFLYVQRLKNYPKIAYWVTWQSWYGVKMALSDNLNASQLLNDSYVINRDNL